jgi:hypothetical protein
MGKVVWRIIAGTVPTRAPITPIAILWRMTWNAEVVSCVVYRREDGLRLQLESPTATILTEPFELQPRMLARSQALRKSLQRRGWQDAPAE